MATRNVKIVTKNITGEVVCVSSALTPRGAAKRYWKETREARQRHLSDSMEFMGKGADDAMYELRNGAGSDRRRP